MPLKMIKSEKSNMEQGRNTLLYLLLYGQLSYIHILLKFRLWLWPFRRRAFIWKATDLKRKKAFNQFKDLSRDCIFLCLLWHSWSIGDTSDYKWLLNNVKEEINYSIFFWCWKWTRKTSRTEVKPHKHLSGYDKIIPHKTMYPNRSRTRPIQQTGTGARSAIFCYW